MGVILLFGVGETSRPSVLVRCWFGANWHKCAFDSLHRAGAPQAPAGPAASAAPEPATMCSVLGNEITSPKRDVESAYCVKLRVALAQELFNNTVSSAYTESVTGVTICPAPPLLCSRSSGAKRM